MRSFIADRIQLQCSAAHSFLNFSIPSAFPRSYVDLYLLPYVSSQRWLDIEDLKSIGIFHLAKESSASRILLQDTIAHSRLMILGKPGTGKTTALQYLALQCSQGHINSDRFPVLVTLRDCLNDFTAAEFRLENYLYQQWIDCGLSLEQVQTWLKQGKIWLLLDGLDEINSNRRAVLQGHIQQWADTYAQMPIVVTSRLAAQDYCFRGFTYTEVADFDRSQVETFVQKWFAAATAQSDRNLAQQFLNELQKQENQLIGELVTTPVLLHLICHAFQEQGRFPRKRSRLYQHGLDILLTQWDAVRGIDRNLEDSSSTSDLLNILSQIAASMFVSGQYVFEKSEILAIIFNGLVVSSDSSQDWETLWSKSSIILQIIVSHHGLLVQRAQDIYSFSHVTFQEYLTARKFFTNSLASSISASKETIYSLKQLAEHRADPRWQNVIGLTTELLSNAKPIFLQRHLIQAYFN